jgi:hypothetical protein
VRDTAEEDIARYRCCTAVGNSLPLNEYRSDMYGWEDCPGNHEDIIRSAMETRLCDAFFEVNSEVENKMLDDAR